MPRACLLECGSTGIYDNGNSSIIRILPIALYLHRVFGPEFPHLAEAYSIIHSVSALTHAHPISLIACRIYCAAANDLLCGKSDIQEGIESATRFYQRSSELAPYWNNFERIDATVLRALPKSEISSGEYVVHTLEAALWCLLQHNDYCSCLLEAINLGEDMDTVDYYFPG